MIIVFEVDIPALTQDGIMMNDSFRRVIELNSSSKIDELIMIEMLILLIDSFDRSNNIQYSVTEPPASCTIY